MHFIKGEMNDTEPIKLILTSHRRKQFIKSSQSNKFILNDSVFPYPPFSSYTIISSSDGIDITSTIHLNLYAGEGGSSKRTHVIKFTEDGIKKLVISDARNPHVVYEITFDIKEKDICDQCIIL